MSRFRNLLKESLRKILLEVKMPTASEVTSGGLPVLYRVGKRPQVESIFKNGYNRQFAGMAGGLMYGVGTYCNDNLEDAKANVGVAAPGAKAAVGMKEYGDTIFKMYLAGGYYGFIIFNKSKAMQVYGNDWKIEDQLRKVYGATDDEIRRIKGECDAKIRMKGGSYYHGRTAPAAHGFAQCKDFIRSHGVKGVVYTGLRDGACVVPYDFGAVIPYSVSFDKGKTFKVLFNAKEYEERINRVVDVQFNYGRKYKKVFEPSAGFAMVINNQNKYNFVDIKDDQELSPYWFDRVDGPVDIDTKEFGFTYKGLELTGTVENVPGNNEKGCVLNEGEPYCNFSDLEDLVAAINGNNNGDVDDTSQVTESRMISEMIEEDYGSFKLPSEDEIRSGKMTAIYRATPSKNIESIFKKGFNRQFAGSNVGSVYGEGTYCMTTFEAALRNVPGYGDTVLKMYVIGGFQGFVIYNERIAKEVYGKDWAVRDQLVNVFKISTSEIPYFNDPRKVGCNQDFIMRHGIRGMIYSWGPGYAVNVFDFSTLIPYAVYYPKTKKWVERFDYNEYDSRINDNIDVKFRYSKRYSRVFEAINGFAMVSNKQGKFNFVDIRDDKELSPFWFDEINDPLDKDTNEFTFTYKGLTLTGTVENVPGNNEKGCVLNEGEPYCNFSDLEDLIQAINQ
jgi:hypothetical protein